MQAVTTVGLDIAKSVFQVHSIGTSGQIVFRKLMASADVVEHHLRRPKGS